MFTTWYKLIGENEVEFKDTIYAGIQPDYPSPFYFIRDNKGIQIEFPVTSIVYIKFSSEKWDIKE